MTFLIEEDKKPNIFEERWQETKRALLEGRALPNKNKNKKFMEVILVGSQRIDRKEPDFK